jgi:DNA-binding CsgD family transcriptional regulator
MTPTPRELEVLRVYVSLKGSRKATGDALGLSPHTVHAHVQNAYAKIGVDCLLDAAEWLRVKV